MDISFPLRRAFLALPLDVAARQRFADAQKKLQEFEPFFRFQNPETAHLTLHFFGALMQIEYADILRRTESIAARTKPFTIHVTGAGVFEGKDPPRVLFLTIDRSEELSKLKKLCPWPNNAPFSPHITIARMKNPHDFIVHRKKIMKLFKDVSFEVTLDRMRLYAEVEGKQQTPVQDFSFNDTPSLRRGRG